MLSKKIQLVISGILALMVQSLGDTAPLVKAIFVLVIIDVVTGLICAKYYRHEDIKTRKFVRKIKEMGLFGVGLAAFVFSDDAFVTFGLTSLWGAKFYCATYTFYELFSILENLGDMGFPVASQIKQALKAKLPKHLQGDKNDTPKK